MNPSFMKMCQQIQRLIYYSLIFYRRFDRSKAKMLEVVQVVLRYFNFFYQTKRNIFLEIKMISSFERIFEELEKTSSNKELPIFFLTYILNHDEIKIKLCEKLLINCRFSNETFKAGSSFEKQNFTQFFNPSDNNVIVFKNFQRLLVI